MVRPVGADRRWGTHHPGYPSALCDAASGLQLRIAGYSGRQERVVDFAGAEGVCLGAHTLDGGYLEAGLDVAGSQLRLEAAKDPEAPTTIVGRLTLEHAAELRLRLWSLLVLERDAAAGRLDDATLAAVAERPAEPGADPLVLRARARSEHLAVVCDPEPSVCAGYPEAAEAVAELEAEGYFPPPRAPVAEPGAAVARFNHEVSPEVRFAAALATDAEAAAAAAWAALADVDGTIAAARRRAEAEPGGQAAAAVRDVLAWNTCWNPANGRLTTVLSRHWTSRKFGGWLVWQSDVLYAALLAATLGDAELAYANLEAVLHGAQPAGNLACLLSARTEWVDRAHPPLAALIVWQCAARLGDRSLPRRHLDTLLRAHRWWERHRAAGDGLLAYGTSPTGRGLYAGTAFAARNESSMDNSPMFDGVGLTGDGVLDLAEVGLNALHVLDGEILAALAAEAGRPDEAAALAEGSARRAEAVRRHLWDAERGVFAGRRGDGTFTASLSPTSLYPLLAGIADDAEVEALVEGHLLDEEGFWGGPPLPANALREPAAAEGSYWRGRAWPPLAYLVHLGLHRCGRRDVAAELAERAWQLFSGPWRERRAALEYYDVRWDSDHADPDVDAFYTWSALLPLITLGEAGDITPWHGARLGPGRGAVLLDGRWWQVEPGEGGLEVRPPSGPGLRVDGVDHLTGIAEDRGVPGPTGVARGSAGAAEPAALRCTLPAGSAPARLRLATGGLTAAVVGSEPAEVERDGDGVGVTVGPRARPTPVVLLLAEAAPDA